MSISEDEVRLIADVLGGLIQPSDSNGASERRKPDDAMRAIVRQRLGCYERHPHGKWRETFRFGKGYLHFKARLGERFWNVQKAQARAAATTEHPSLFLMITYFGSKTDDQRLHVWALPGSLVHATVDDAREIESAPTHGYCSFGITAEDRFDLGRLAHLAETPLKAMDLRRFHTAINLRDDELALLH